MTTKQYPNRYGPLGHSTEYKNTYSPELLYPIARDPQRKTVAIPESAIQNGVDIWTAYELSWLNLKGKPIVAGAEILVPASSLNIIESKSLKLYLNSFNQTSFASDNDVLEHIITDLSQAAGTKVDVQLFSLDSECTLPAPPGQCLDSLDVSIQCYEPTPSLLKLSPSSHEEIVHESLYSHLLKSNCPVTNQPDWATILISYSGTKICESGLLSYLVSYRNHSDFHEHCVETIFADIWEHCRPNELSVYARYLRRGGLDINPYRSSTPKPAPKGLRFIRQ